MQQLLTQLHKQDKVIKKQVATDCEAQLPAQQYNQDDL